MKEEFIFELKIRDSRSSTDEYSEIIDKILKEFGQKIEKSETVEKTNESIGWDTIGSFIVRDKELLVNLYRFIESKDEEYRPGLIKRKDGGEIYAIDSNKEEIEEAGGDIIGEVGDHLLVEIPSNQISELLDFDTLKK